MQSVWRARQIDYELAFAFSTCPPEKYKIQQDNAARINVERKDDRRGLNLSLRLGNFHGPGEDNGVSRFFYP